LALFVSLSIGDMQLPGVGLEMTGSEQGRDILKKKNNVVQWIMSYLNKLRGKSDRTTELPSTYVGYNVGYSNVAPPYKSQY